MLNENKSEQPNIIKDEIISEKNIIKNSETIEVKIDSEIKRSEANQEQLDQNIQLCQGEDGVIKIWTQIDTEKKMKILEKIQEYLQKREAAIDNQYFGTSMINPIHSYDIMMDEEHGVGKIFGLLSGTVMYFSGTAPTMGIVTTIKATFDRLKNSIKANQERRKLKTLEKI